MEEQVFLLLGTNDGNRMANLNSAKDEIKKSVGLVAEESAIYQTAAWGKTDQPDFYNQVLLLQTTPPLAYSTSSTSLKLPPRMLRFQVFT